MISESGWAATSAILDGEAEFGRYGYSASTADRMLYVPHGKAGDAAEAILLCRQQGIIRRKLDAMEAGAANVVYSTTLATAIPQN
jgi:hypothetical protein